MKTIAAGMLAVILVSCSSSDDSAPSTSTNAPTDTGSSVPDVPDVLDGPVSAEVDAAVDLVLDDLYGGAWDPGKVVELAEQGDIRTAWLIADLMRFYQTGAADDALVTAFSDLTGAEPDSSQVSFVWAMNHLIALDLPAWDGYVEAKRDVYTPLAFRWRQFFAGDVAMDWRLVTWGGVLPDERQLGDDSPCNCIPALDYPETTDAEGGDWYPDDRIVFGVVVDGEAIALPKHQMEVHEMVNLTLGGRELGIPYCTLCGSAQAYLVDDVPGVDRVVLRTSGLLQRSNKLMYDLTTGSAINTFTGEALTGPLAEEAVTLNQVSVVASTWGDWKRAHPDTLIIAEDGGIGRTYDSDPLGGRDDDGPIFPIGDVDPRLPVQEKVVGVIAPDGTPVAFPATATRSALVDGPIEYEGLTVRLEDSIRVFDSNGDEVTSHQSFWFAWSQFHTGTVVWDDVGS